MMLITLVSCGHQELPAVEIVALEKYMGTWYEIASLPETNKRGCTCSKFDYKLAADSETVMTINSCMKKGKQGAVLAKAFVDENSGNSKWEVQYFWPFTDTYFVLEVADDYSYAMAGSPDRKNLWILSREREMKPDVYNQLLNSASALGFDISKVTKVIQDCEPE